MEGAKKRDVGLWISVILHTVVLAPLMIFVLLSFLCVGTGLTLDDLWPKSSAAPAAKPEVKEVPPKQEELQRMRSQLDHIELQVDRIRRQQRWDS